MKCGGMSGWDLAADFVFAFCAALKCVKMLLIWRRTAEEAWR